MTYKLEALSEKHLDGINEIDKFSFSRPWSAESFKSELTNPLAVYWVAVDDNDNVIGYGGYWWIFDEANITNIAVHPDYRQKGIASAILKAMCDKCSVTDVLTLNLEVRVSNTPAQSLYKKFGFKEVGVRPKYYDNKEDAILMTKEIEQFD